MPVRLFNRREGKEKKMDPATCETSAKEDCGESPLTAAISFIDSQIKEKQDIKSRLEKYLAQAPQSCLAKTS